MGNVMKTEQNTKLTKIFNDSKEMPSKKAIRYSTSLTAKRSIRPLKSMIRVKSVKPFDTAVFKLGK